MSDKNSTTNNQPIVFPRLKLSAEDKNQQKQKMRARIESPKNFDELAAHYKSSTIQELVRDYQHRTRLYCAPKFAIFNIKRHRLNDLFFGGIPFTSQKWPWPNNKIGIRLYPIAQIDLKNAGKNLELNIGDGILQVWGEYIDGSVYEGFLGNFENNERDEDWRLAFSNEFQLDFRVIPRGDLQDSLTEESYIETSSVGGKLFQKYVELAGITLNRHKLEWQSPKRMHFPSFVEFCQCYGYPDEFSDQIPYDLDDKLKTMKVPTSNNIASSCWLGGYLPTLYHHSIDYKSNMLLFFRNSGDFAITYNIDKNGSIEFALESHYDSLD